MKGPRNTNKIITELNISTQQIIESLRNLEKKGIVLADYDDHNFFSALPFEKALKLLIKTEKKQTEMFQTILLKNWKTILKSKNKLYRSREK
jgi:hypothetical protein